MLLSICVTHTLPCAGRSISLSLGNAQVASRPDNVPLTLTPGELSSSLDKVAKAGSPVAASAHGSHGQTAGLTNALKQLSKGATVLDGGHETPETIVESIRRLRAAAEETIAEADRALQSLGVAVSASGAQAAVGRLELPMGGSAAGQQQQLSQQTQGQGQGEGTNPLENQALEGKYGYSNFQPFPQPWNCDCFHCGSDSPANTQLANHPTLTFEAHDQCQPLCSVGEMCGPKTGGESTGCYTRASAPCNCETRTVVFVEQAECDCYSCGSSEPRDTYYSAHANMTNAGSDHCEPLCLVGPTCSATKGSVVDGCYTKALSPCDCKHRKTIMT